MGTRNRGEPFNYSLDFDPDNTNLSYEPKTAENPEPFRRGSPLCVVHCGSWFLGLFIYFILFL